VKNSDYTLVHKALDLELENFERFAFERWLDAMRETPSYRIGHQQREWVKEVLTRHATPVMPLINAIGNYE
jgi:hypothetical protein